MENEIKNQRWRYFGRDSMGAKIYQIYRCPNNGQSIPYQNVEDVFVLLKDGSWRSNQQLTLTDEIYSGKFDEDGDELSEEEAIKLSKKWGYEFILKDEYKCAYVCSDLTYVEEFCTFEAAEQNLREVTSPEITARLSEAWTQTPEAERGALMPAFVFWRKSGDNCAVMNVFRDDKTWSYVWNFTVPRMKWLPLLTKSFDTDPKDATPQELLTELRRIGIRSISDMVNAITKPE